MNLELLMYHISEENIIDLVPSFCDGLYKQKLKSILIFYSEEILKQCDAKIWTYSSEKFIPHATCFDVDINSSDCNCYLTNNYKTNMQSDVIIFVKNDDMQFESIINHEYNQKISKIILIFVGIISPEKYIEEIQKYNVQNKFSVFKFFSRNSKIWQQIC